MMKKFPAVPAETHVYLDQSRIAGTGVFATRDFTAGEWILSFMEGSPDILPYMATTHTPAQEGYFLQIGADSYILPSSPSIYLNHSCDPNTGARQATELIALIDIAAGTELTFDYSTSMAEDGWEMDCVCAASNCRGRVRDFKHLPPERQNFYIERGIVGGFCLASLTTLTK